MPTTRRSARLKSKTDSPGKSKTPVRKTGSSKSPEVVDSESPRRNSLCRKSLKVMSIENIITSDVHQLHYLKRCIEASVKLIVLSMYGTH